MPSISEMLAAAVRLHQQGQLSAAEQLYQQILIVDPQNADSLHLLGLLALQSQQPMLAVERIEMAIQRNGNEAAYHNNLGEAFRALQRLPEAIAAYQRALQLQPQLADALNNLANAWMEMRDFEQAVMMYRRALALRPNFAAAHYNLGNAFRNLEKWDQALACYEQVLRLKPQSAEAYKNRGVVKKALGQIEDAIASYQLALQIQPRDADTLCNLGNAYAEQGRCEDAVAAYRRSLEIEPQHVRALNNLGSQLQSRGELADAIALYQKAIARAPTFAEGYYNLGTAYGALKKLTLAEDCYRRALALRPHNYAMLNNLGLTLQSQGKFAEAAECFQQSLRVNPTDSAAYNHLGSAYESQRKLDAAVACYRRALALKSGFADAHNNLGNVLKSQRNLEESLACFQQAIDCQPNFPVAFNNWGNALKELGRVDEAMDKYRQALTLDPHFAEAHSNLLMTLHYRTGISLEELAAAHAEFDRQHALPLVARSLALLPVRGSAEKLRIGFVSPNLMAHPVGYFLVRALENLDRDRFETLCYSDQMVEDEVTRRLQAASAGWHNVVGTSDEDLALQIREDAIDILFDLAGHTAHNRLLVFARKPAPVQITWAGYVGTTGLSAMDYLLADRFQVPLESQHHYREQVLWMPQGYICYDPPPYSPVVTPLPALARGQFTFGCFNNPAKITPQVVKVWCEVLQRLPTARLMLKYKGWNDPLIARRYLDLFARNGVDATRLELQGYSAHAATLAEYGRIDLALDPFPYSGGLTTCEALWMGVPVITVPGGTFASRHSLSHLSNVGMTETIACDLREYVELAVAWAEDLPRLAKVRAELRPRMGASPLCDGVCFAKDLEQLLIQVWRNRTTS